MVPPWKEWSLLVMVMEAGRQLDDNVSVAAGSGMMRLLASGGQIMIC
jgi:hypothetical protein